MPHQQTIALHLLPTGRSATIARMCCADKTAIRAQAMGLREGKSVEVLRRNGRMLLVNVGATQLAISADLACDIQVR